MTLQLYLQSANTSTVAPPEVQQFKTWVEAALKNQPDLLQANEVELTLRLVDEAESAELNYKYRHKPAPTNILSFPTENFLQAKPCYLGDLVICVPLVQKEAIAQGKEVIAHWAHLTIHGVLHLLGHDHEQEQEAALMEGIEIEVLASLGFGNPYSP